MKQMLIALFLFIVVGGGALLLFRSWFHSQTISTMPIASIAPATSTSTPQSSTVSFLRRARPTSEDEELQSFDNLTDMGDSAIVRCVPVGADRMCTVFVETDQENLELFETTKDTVVSVGKLTRAKGGMLLDVKITQAARPVKLTISSTTNGKQLFSTVLR